MTHPDDKALPYRYLKGHENYLSMPSSKLIRHAPDAKVLYFLKKPNRQASLICGAVFRVEI